MSDDTHRRGLLLAACTAVISGVAVFVNGLGVRSWSEIADPSTYTTAKNAVAAVILGAAAVVLARRASREQPRLPQGTGAWAGVAVVVVVGGSVPFLLFFEGLARTDSTQAAFIHKTLVIWVALFAAAALRERLGAAHLIAITALVAGEAVMVGGVSGLSAGPGEAMILAATLLWSIEVVLSKRLLRNVPAATLSLARMAGGSALLALFLLLRRSPIDVAALGWEHLGWVLLAGGLLAGYVATWHLALARAPAVDVTAVLVGGALITAVLRTGLDATPLAPPLGLALLVIGVAAVFAARRSVPA